MLYLCEDKCAFEEKYMKRIFVSPIFRFNDENIDTQSFPGSKSSFASIKLKNELEINKISHNSRNSLNSEKLNYF